LIEVVSTIICICTVQHTAFNIPQWDFYGFVAATPGSMYSAPPGSDGKAVQKGVITKSDIMKALPPKFIAAKQLGMIYLLTVPSDEDRSIDSVNPEEPFVEPQVHTALAAFRNRLNEIEDKIAKRKEWPYLLPSQLQSSISM